MYATDSALALVPAGACIAFVRRSEARRVFYVNPCAIRAMLESRDVRSLIGSDRFIVPGDWDIRRTVPIRSRVIDSAVRELWEQGLDYRSTEQYATMKRAVQLYLLGHVRDPARFGAYWCRSFADIDRYFEHLSRCFDDIRDEGYKSQAELSMERPADVRDLGDEIQIAINRVGEPVLIASNGNHRFSIARLLGLTQIPANLYVVSEEWVRERVPLRGRGKFQLVASIVDAAKTTLSKQF